MEPDWGSRPLPPRQFDEAPSRNFTSGFDLFARLTACAWVEAAFFVGAFHGRTAGPTRETPKPPQKAAAKDAAQTQETKGPEVMYRKIKRWLTWATVEEACELKPLALYKRIFRRILP